MSANCLLSRQPATLDDILDELRRLTAATTAEPSAVLTREQLAELLVVGVSTLDTLRATGKIGPHEFKLGSSVRWRRDEVLAWLSYPNDRRDLPDARTWAAIWPTIGKGKR
jgi:excisionase family DNA binding protein